MVSLEEAQKNNGINKGLYVRLSRFMRYIRKRAECGKGWGLNLTAEVRLRHPTPQQCVLLKSNEEEERRFSRGST